MKRTMTEPEEILRVAGGATILLIGLCFQNAWGLIGLASIATVLIAWCPVHALLGLRVAVARAKRSGGFR